MSNLRFFLFFLFWVALFNDCFFIFSNYQEYRLYTKTLLAPLLLIVIDFEAKDSKHQRSRLLVNLAFLFCFIGDFLLLDSAGSGNFVLGICSFLFAHIFFI